MKYLVWNPEECDEKHAREVESCDAGDAAEKWAEEDDLSSGEYNIVEGSVVTLCVKDNDGKVTKFRVCGEMTPTYDAVEVTE